MYVCMTVLNEHCIYRVSHLRWSTMWCSRVRVCNQQPRVLSLACVLSSKVGPRWVASSSSQESHQLATHTPNSILSLVFIVMFSNGVKGIEGFSYYTNISSFDSLQVKEPVFVTGLALEYRQ